MAKTTTFTFRLSPETKQQATELFENIGISMADAMNLFLHQAIAEGGIPFAIKQKTNRDEMISDEQK